MKAVLFVGGWEGHKPTAFADCCTALPEGEGFDVTVHETPRPFATPGSIPTWI